jgi:hydroxypyruvate reductase
MPGFSFRDFAGEFRKRIDAETLVEQMLKLNPDLSLPASRVVACGKTSFAMLKGLDRQIGLKADFIGVSPEQHRPQFNNLAGRCLKGSHPLPDHFSLQAAKEVCDFVSKGNQQQNLIVLISGGTSSLIAMPAEGVSENTLIDCHKQLIYSGLSIRQINMVRRRISAVKGGQLLFAALKKHKKVNVLAISDVASNNFHEIGSGPFSPDPEPRAQAFAIASGLTGFPAAALAAIKSSTDYNEAFFKKNFAEFDQRYSQTLVFSQQQARQIAVKVLHEQGEKAEPLEVSYLHNLFSATKLPSDLENKWLVACGEREICLPPGLQPKKGGRASHNLLEAALQLIKNGLTFELAILASDGCDGNSGNAGGFIASKMLGSEDISDIKAACANFDSAGWLTKKNLHFAGFRGETNVGDIYLFRATGRR